jgi:hypothetical protein
MGLRASRAVSSSWVGKAQAQCRWENLGFDTDGGVQALLFNMVWLQRST